MRASLTCTPGRETAPPSQIQTMLELDTDDGHDSGIEESADMIPRFDEVLDVLLKNCKSSGDK